MKITVDRDACIGAGQCALVAGAVFDQDDEGLVVLLNVSPGEDMHTFVHKAAKLCPASAIAVED